MTSPLSGVRSNQLSYRPASGRPAHPPASSRRLQSPAPAVQTESCPAHKKGDCQSLPRRSASGSAGIVFERPVIRRPLPAGGPHLRPPGAPSRKPKRVSAQPELPERDRPESSARPSPRCAQHRRGLRTGLLRKEVIQPHLPIRLPCYDLAPLTGHTFGDSLPCGLGHRLRVQPTQVT